MTYMDCNRDVRDTENKKYLLMKWKHEKTKKFI